MRCFFKSLGLNLILTLALTRYPPNPRPNISPMFFEINTAHSKSTQLVRCFSRTPPYLPTLVRRIAIFFDINASQYNIVRSQYKAIQHSRMFFKINTTYTICPMFSPVTPHLATLFRWFQSQHNLVLYAPMFFHVSTGLVTQPTLYPLCVLG